MIDEVSGRRQHAAPHEPVIPAIVEGVARTSGREFYRRLSEQLGLVFGSCAVRVCELSPDGRHASTLGAWSRAGFALPEQFDLEDGPEAAVARGEPVVHERQLRGAYPRSQLLTRIYAESYVGVPMADAQGDVLGFIELFGDTPMTDSHRAVHVTLAMAGRAVAEIERDQAEAALRDSEMRYRALIEDSFHLVAEVVDERYIYVSAGYMEALGYAAEELLGGSLFELVHPEDRAKVSAELKPIAATREAARFTARMRHRDGSWRWIESTARAFRASTGEYRTTIFSRDITERLQAERELRESEAMFRLLAENSTDMIGRYAVDGRCIWISPSAFNITGYTPEELVATHPEQLIHRDDVAGVWEAFGAMVAGEAARTATFRFITSGWKRMARPFGITAATSSRSVPPPATSQCASRRRKSCERVKRGFVCCWKMPATWWDASRRTPFASGSHLPLRTCWAMSPLS
jgi:PAS domain S-box-containing protein